MAAFASEAEAQALAITRMTAGTYLEAYGMRQADGTIAMRVLLPLQSSGTGGWSEITDNS